jgi:hypothetical protein
MDVKKAEKCIRSLLSSINRVKQLGIILAVSISLSLIFSQTAYASIDVGTFDRAAYAYYIDPGTVGMLLQGLVGVAVAALAMGVVFRRRITYWVKSKFKRSGKSEDEEDTESVLPAETKSESGE